jgi:hypothetical protein
MQSLGKVLSVFVDRALLKRRPTTYLPTTCLGVRARCTSYELHLATLQMGVPCNLGGDQVPSAFISAHKKVPFEDDEIII